MYLCISGCDPQFARGFAVRHCGSLPEALKKLAAQQMLDLSFARISGSVELAQWHVLMCSISGRAQKHHGVLAFRCGA